MLQPADQEQVQYLRDEKGQQGDPDRSADVLAGIKAGCQHFDQNQAEQPNTVGDQCVARPEHVVGGESAMMEQGGDQRHGENAERQGRWRRQQKGQPQAPVEQSGIFLVPLCGMAFGQRGKQNGAECGAEHAGRKFHQAVGIIKPGDTAGFQEGSEDGVQQQADLRHGNTEHGWRHQSENAPDPIVVQIDRKSRQHANTPQARDLEGELQGTTKKDGPAEGHDRRVEVGRCKECHQNERNIEQHRRECGYGEAAPGIENATGQRDQRHEKDVGESDARQLDGQGKLFGVIGKTRSRKVNEYRRGRHAEQGDRQHDEKQQTRDTVYQLPGLLGWTLVPVLAKDRNEGLRKSAFGKQSAQQVGELEGNKESVGQRPGTESAGDHEIADKTEYARQQGHTADGGEGLQEVHGLSGQRLRRNPLILAPGTPTSKTPGYAFQALSGLQATGFLLPVPPADRSRSVP
ncbi:MAG: hypothetical protein AW09_001940 [Candidatus Accumulibacter phosphatis]|uniref:Uncharacterized protein n=1 Tax=Candidatus Accumulibacter phosphatis TaxID=327160 RepID=A0A080LVV7_9PROT|nr:MAG: hypothetical protein AW09_001940 [Candidatus Accumulibacter phosphatis]